MSKTAQQQDKSIIVFTHPTAQVLSATNYKLYKQLVERAVQARPYVTQPPRVTLDNEDSCYYLKVGGKEIVIADDEFVYLKADGWTQVMEQIKAQAA